MDGLASPKLVISIDSLDIWVILLLILILLLLVVLLIILYDPIRMSIILVEMVATVTIVTVIARIIAMTHELTPSNYHFHKYLVDDERTDLFIPQIH